MYRVLKGTVIQGYGAVEVGQELNLSDDVARSLTLIGRVEKIAVEEAPEVATDAPEQIAVEEAPEVATSRGRRKH